LTGQERLLRDVLAAVRSVPGNGVDPADPASGNVWDNRALFDYDGRALPALRAFASPA
jgi:arabinogalactan endo-1,4-beta-galactosidase